MSFCKKCGAETNNNSVLCSDCTILQQHKEWLIADGYIQQESENHSLATSDSAQVSHDKLKTLYANCSADPNSLIIGIVLSFFFDLIGMIIVYILFKDNYRKGAFSKAKGLNIGSFIGYGCRIMLCLPLALMFFKMSRF